MNLLWFIVLFVMCSILVTTIYERRRAKKMDEICKAAREINEQYRQGKLKM